MNLTPQLLQETFEPISQVEPDELQYLIDTSEIRSLKKDEFLFKKDEPSDLMSFVLSGRISIYTVQKDQKREIFLLEKGDITGLLPYSRLTHAQGYGLVVEDAVILSFHRKDMPELIRNHYNLTAALVHHMSSRIREFTTYQQQNEKMMALGKLSAGLAHELNNPASAIVRSSKELQSHLAQVPDTFKKVISIRMTEEQVDAVNKILFQRLQNPPTEKPSLLQRQGQEDEIVDCLEDLDVENAEEIAENLVEFGFLCEEIETIQEKTGPDHMSPVMNWINNNLITEKMVSDIEEASNRIAELVGSVKTFTHMDRSPERIAANVHDGIENTLVMLNHKVKQGGLKVNRAFADDLPKAQIFVSELNQVWTNLIDNAIDALQSEENPELTIRTRGENGFVKVEVIDNGPGIQADVLSSIFDPFFTTKEIGKGTGLGLDVAKKIVQRHNGTLRVESEKGRTAFEVCLPLA